jgi:predicted transcriptional regulator
MKIKFLKITFESLEDFKARTAKALEEAINTGKKSIQKKDTLIWSSVEAYQQFMSDQKYTILAAIYKHQPQSVYQLAKLLNRAQQNVARDCDMLALHGFIKFEEEGDGRKTKAPRLAFDYNAILVQLPSLSYKIAFENEAA